MARRLVITAALSLLSLAAAPAVAGAATAVSSNWAGYAVSGKKFRRVAASWTVPRATCSSGTTYSADWVGLGGNSESSQALEQVGTETDCVSGGRAYYMAWYELVPDVSHAIRVKVHAGDTVSASVQVRGTRVVLHLRNRSTGASFSRTLRMSSPDVSSAEWIAEAPYACDATGRCRQPALTNFGTLSFRSASATSTSGHTGSISDPAWTATRIELVEGAGQPGFASAASVPGALPSDLAPGGTAFAIAYEEQGA